MPEGKHWAHHHTRSTAACRQPHCSPFSLPKLPCQTFQGLTCWWTSGASSLAQCRRPRMPLSSASLAHRLARTREGRWPRRHPYPHAIPTTAEISTMWVNRGRLGRLLHNLVRTHRWRGAAGVFSVFLPGIQHPDSFYEARRPQHFRGKENMPGAILIEAHGFGRVLSNDEHGLLD
jgi:hypothetical protein